MTVSTSFDWSYSKSNHRIRVSSLSGACPTLTCIGWLEDVLPSIFLKPKLITWRHGIAEIVRNNLYKPFGSDDSSTFILYNVPGTVWWFLSTMNAIRTMTYSTVTQEASYILTPTRAACRSWRHTPINPFITLMNYSTASTEARKL